MSVTFLRSRETAEEVERDCLKQIEVFARIHRFSAPQRENTARESPKPMYRRINESLERDLPTNGKVTGKGNKKCHSRQKVSQRSESLTNTLYFQQAFSRSFRKCIPQLNERAFDRLAARAFFAHTENFYYEGLTRKSERFRTGYMLTWIMIALFAFIARRIEREWRAD